MGDTLEALAALQNEGFAHIYDMRLDLAEKLLLATLEGYKAVHFRHLHYTFDLLRHVYRLKGDLVNEVFYSMEMIRSLDACGGKEEPKSMANEAWRIAGIANARQSGYHEHPGQNRTIPRPSRLVDGSLSFGLTTF
jgi:hypothetical protein